LAFYFVCGFDILFDLFVFRQIKHFQFLLEMSVGVKRARVTKPFTDAISAVLI
jgi:hypothetical protein